MPNDVTMPLFIKSRELGIAISFGYAEITPEGSHFNTSILTDNNGNIIGKYRKVHLPGHLEYDNQRAFQYPENGIQPRPWLPVWHKECHYGHAFATTVAGRVYREMGLQGVELLMLGYNTPSVNSQMADEGQEK